MIRKSLISGCAVALSLLAPHAFVVLRVVSESATHA